MISKINFDKEKMFLHATTSEEKAKSITERGLYTYGDDLSAFSFQWCGDISNDKDIEGILAYGYGGLVESSKANNYVILFRMPNDELKIETLSEQEQEQAQEFIEARRFGLISLPTHKINKRDILGYIDKKKGQVIFNPCFTISNYEHEKEEETHD